MFISYESIKKYLHSQNYIFTGNPIRENLIPIKKRKASKELGLSPNKKTIFILGGSQGSMPINRFFIKNYKELIANNIQIIWQTGSLEFEKINQIVNSPQIIIKSFIKDIAIPYSSADIVISRAGALAIEELKSFGKPMILIPYPESANNHQKLNAIELVENNAAKLVEQHEMEEKLIHTINKLINNNTKMRFISENALKKHNSNSLDIIVNTIKECLNV